MNRHLIYMIIALFAAVLFVGHIANKNYEARKELERQLASERQSVYDMQYLNYQKEQEIEQIRQSLENTGLCDIILTKNI